jgi:hypothetical protein
MFVKIRMEFDLPFRMIGHSVLDLESSTSSSGSGTACYYGNLLLLIQHELRGGLGNHLGICNLFVN